MRDERHGSVRTGEAGPRSLVGAVVALLLLAGCAALDDRDGGASTGADDPSAGPSVEVADLPRGWPSTLQLGMSDEPGGAGALVDSVPVGVRYQYLAGGVNTGHGWTTWQPDGRFAASYIEESARHDLLSVFSYYMLYQSSPGDSQGEADGVATNLSEVETMQAYYADLASFFEQAGEADGTTVLHVEPDLWGYMQQRADGDDATTVPVAVASTGVAELAGLPDDASGFAQAIVRLRDLAAPDVLLAFHASPWGTGVDFTISDRSDDEVAEIGVRTGRHYRSLGASFDLVFTDLADRDAGFKEVQDGDGGATWFDADDYRHSTVFIDAVVRTAGVRAVIWQIPLGNTRMRAVDNSWNHYQDDKVERLLDDPARRQLQAYVDAGVVGLLFGRGADGATCACDANGDGVTNPRPVNGNGRPSLSADDDGGFFRDRVRAYDGTGAIPLDG